MKATTEQINRQQKTNVATKEE